MEPSVKPEKSSAIAELPVLPLRDVVVYPHMVIPLFVGREKSMKALDMTMAGDKRILLVAQRGADIDDPKAGDLYPIGTIASILQLLKLPDGTVKVLVEGSTRAEVVHYGERDGVMTGHVRALEPAYTRSAREIEVVVRTVVSQFESFVKLNRKIPPELLTTLAGIDDASRLADTIAAHLSIRLSDKRRLLEAPDVADRLEMLIGFVEGQREYYLNEQMKAIQKELGENEEAPNEIEELGKKIEKAGMPKPVEKKARAELNKLKQMSPMSAEATVVRNYIDWLVGALWRKRSMVRRVLKVAEEVLDADHYGLEKVKERIVEYLAVQQRVKKMKAPILCLVGPPGVGKTSLGQSIARATNRKFVRMSDT